MSTDKENRVSYLEDRSRRRKERKKNKLNENTLEMQERYEQEGFKNIAEIAFLMANESWEDLIDVREEHGIASREYDQAFQRTNSAVKTALPFFALQLRPENIPERDEELTQAAIEKGIANLVGKNS